MNLLFKSDLFSHDLIPSLKLRLFLMNIAALGTHAFNVYNLWGRIHMKIMYFSEVLSTC